MRLHRAPNFRDLGGYTTAEGRRVRPGLIYRSDSMARLRPADWRQLAGAGVRTVVDFRAPDERRSAPDSVPSDFTLHWLPVDVGGKDLRDEVQKALRGAADRDTSEILVEINRLFVLEFSDVFAEWLRLLFGSDETVPQVFHCSAGKDRTGFAAALLLRILGVPHQTVIEDYLASNRYLRRFVERSIRRVRFFAFAGKRAEVIRPILTADTRYLAAAFETIEQTYGSFDTYVSNGLGLSSADRDMLQKRFLEPAPESVAR